MPTMLRKVLISFGAIVLTFTFLSQANILKYAISKSKANEPAIQEDSWFFYSGLKKTKRNDFVIFRVDDGKYIFRAVGLPGDKIEIKDAVLYVNDVNTDENLELKHYYTLTAKEFDQFITGEVLDLDDINYRIYADNDVFVELTNTVADKYNLTSKRNKSRALNAKAEEIFEESWNQDDFGPFVVPSGKYFLLGDSRHNANDSRFIGFISKDDIIGTLF